MLEGIYCRVCHMDTNFKDCIKTDEAGRPSPCAYLPKAAVGDEDWANIEELSQVTISKANV